VKAHAAAATDGERLVIVGEDGSPAGPVESAANDLLAAARAGLAARATAADLSSETRETLRALGYVE
jgi:hypothetical protein